MVLYILFWWSGTPARSQLCSARSSVSGGVFLMYPWREMYSKSTYSSALLDLPQMTTMSSHGSRIGQKVCSGFPPTLMEKPKWTFWSTLQIVGLGFESDAWPLLTFLCNTSNREVTIWNFFFFKSSNGFHTGHIGRPGIQKKEISFDIMFTFLINRLKNKTKQVEG